MKDRTGERIPRFSAIFLAAMAAACLLAGGFAAQKGVLMDFSAAGLPPSSGHPFGTDYLGRDVLWMILSGGRSSLFIGLAAAAVSTGIAALYGCAAGVLGKWGDDLLMRFSEILLSVPQLLLILFLQAALGEPTTVSLALIIGMTGWMAVAKVVRNEVRRIRRADHVLAARMMGGGFLYLLRYHYWPAFWPAIMFMTVSNIGNAIAMEATLSFLGVGLPASAVSWGSLMASSQRALLSGAWWLLAFPGGALAGTLICATNLGEYIRLKKSRERLTK